MRILIVLPSINPLTGGPAKSNLLQAKELALSGHHVELFSTSWPDLGTPNRGKIEQDGFVIRLFRATSLPGLGHVPYSPTLLTALTKEVQNFDIVHFGSLWNPLISRAMAILRQSNVPYVITPHGMMDPIVFSRNRFLKACWAWMFERQNVEEADLVVFTSEGEESKARTQGWRLRRTIILPNVVDLTAGLNLPPRHQIESKYPQLSGHHVVIFVGRIDWVKNLDKLIAAIALLREKGKDVLLLCVGPDNDGYQAGLERLADELGIRDSVIFTGLLEGEDLQAVFARADVLALVSQKENFGRSAADALAAGVPIVLSGGVDQGENWPKPPVWRVEQSKYSIACGLDDALAYSSSSGLPASEARDLARREWGNSRCGELIASYETVISER
jgi:glycosyltransferase involved in cell wall biosynthesis